MLTEFETVGLLDNQAENKRSSNPWELADFKYQIKDTDKFEDNEIYKDHIYYMSGEVPLKLDISKDGIISGKINLLNNQPNKDIDFYPLEPIKKDGSNWTNNGRPKSPFIEFNFKIIKKTVYKNLDVLNLLFLRHLNFVSNPDIAPIPEPTNQLKENEISNLIEISKNHPDIPKKYNDSQITILEGFLSKDIILEKFYYCIYENDTDVSIKVIKNNDLENLIFVKNYMDQGYGLNIGNDTYYKKDINLYLNVHPGPFGIK